MITKEYILQCSQAKQIQEMWKLKARDYIYQKKNKQIYLITNIERKIVFYINIKDGEESWCHEDNFKQYFIYLLTQEQLWEKIKEIYFTENTELMIRNDLKRDIYSVSIYTEIDDNIHTENSEGKIVKECLLKLIMKEYCKSWTGKKWAKSNEK